MIDGNPQAVIANDHGLAVPFHAAPQPFDALNSRQPLCGDSEGWGPLSPSRFDLTPCFLDVWVAVVAAFGLLMGAGAVWFLLKKRIAQPVPKNWHFHAKLVGFYDIIDCATRMKKI
jgi:hypothetical protein